MTPEQQARLSIDAILQQADWHVCSVADHHLFLVHGVVALVDANLKRAHTLRQATLAALFDRASRSKS